MGQSSRDAEPGGIDTGQVDSIDGRFSAGVSHEPADVAEVNVTAHAGSGIGFVITTMLVNNSSCGRRRRRTARART
jgi:hypothetical protein